MKQKLVSVLTALCSIVSFSALPAFAEVYISPSGEMSELGKAHYNVIVLETDGTALTEEMVKYVDGYLALETYDTFKEYCFWGEDMTNIPQDRSTYVIHIENWDRNALTAIGRKLMFEMDCVTDAYLLEEWSYQPIDHIVNGLNLRLTDENIVLSAETIPELKDFKIRQELGTIYALLDCTEEHSAWIEEQNMSDYEKYVYFTEIANTLLETYPDILAKAECSRWVLDISLNEYYASSIWQTAGDSNADGAVTAEDAADLLVTAAAAGSGAEITATAASDVNADGTVSADDAAAVLVYAAAQGSGSPVSWVEILCK